VLLAAGFEEEGDEALVLRSDDKDRLSSVLEAVSAEAVRAAEEARNDEVLQAREEEERRNVSAMVRESLRQKKDQEANVRDT
jgi:hypothetical protein